MNRYEKIRYKGKNLADQNIIFFSKINLKYDKCGDTSDGAA